MDISDRIKKLGRYFSEMQVTTVEGKQIIYVVVNYPHGWVIDEEFAKEKKVTIAQGANIDEYGYCADIETGADAIFDVIDSNILKMKEAIERGKILTEKTQRLKALFEDEKISIEKLKSIRFVMDDETDIVIPKTEENKKGKKNE